MTSASANRPPARANEGIRSSKPATSDYSSVRSFLTSVFGIGESVDGAFVKAGMSAIELDRLYDLVRTPSCSDALEIGMANGTTSVVICHAFSQRGHGRLTSIDPFQLTSDGYAGEGVRNLEKAGLTQFHRLRTDPDYLALPKLLLEGAQFDLVLIDGWHSFDYTLLDLFYADLLLRPGGLLIIHDSTSPPVFKAVRFLETHKPYERLSPPPMISIPSLTGRLLRRLRLLVSGRQAMAQARERREQWKMLVAYRKIKPSVTPEKLLCRF